MDIVIAGGHGQIALLRAPLLAGRGDRVRGLIRNPDHSADLAAAGAEAVVCDLEAAEVEDIAGAIAGADAFVFAAGAGPGSGPQRKWTMDYAGAVKGMAACRQAGVGRYVIVSSMGADPEADDDGAFGTYLKAKGKADEKLAESGLDYTVVRPGALTDEPPTGRVAVGARLGRGTIPRADVAAVLAGVLATPATVRRAFDVLVGDTAIEAALQGLTGPRCLGT